MHQKDYIQHQTQWFNNTAKTASTIGKPIFKVIRIKQFSVSTVQMSILKAIWKKQFSLKHISDQPFMARITLWLERVRRKRKKKNKQTRKAEIRKTQFLLASEAHNATYSETLQTATREHLIALKTDSSESFLGTSDTTPLGIMQIVREHSASCLSSLSHCGLILAW